MQIWCQGCGKFYEDDMKISECPFCYTINYSEVKDGNL